MHVRISLTHFLSSLITFPRNLKLSTCLMLKFLISNSHLGFFLLLKSIHSDYSHLMICSSFLISFVTISSISCSFLSIYHQNSNICVYHIAKIAPFPFGFLNPLSQSKCRGWLKAQHFLTSSSFLSTYSIRFLSMSKRFVFHSIYSRLFRRLSLTLFLVLPYQNDTKIASFFTKYIYIKLLQS